jgi:arginase
MERAARLPLPYPEAAVVEESSLPEQTFAIATELPDRPLVLGGCCCAHIGAVEALAARHGRISLVWLDAHGDLNTPQTSPSGNVWGMPLRMLVDSGAVDPQDVALVGARNLDPPEQEFIAAARLRIGADQVADAVAGTEGTYIAFDADSVEPGELEVFMPEPGGMRLEEVQQVFGQIRDRSPILGAGITALAPDERNVEPVKKLLSGLGL